MPGLSKNHTVTRKLPIHGLSDESGEPVGPADFIVTYRILSDEELGEFMNSWRLGYQPDAVASQKAGLEKILVKAECKAYFPNPGEALAYLKDGSAPVRGALLKQYQEILAGDILTKN